MVETSPKQRTPQYTTHLRGRHWIESDGHQFGFEVRVIEDPANETFLVTQGPSLWEQRFVSLDGAIRAVELVGDGANRGVEWETTLEPRPGEVACFVCGLGAGLRLESAERYPHELCSACTWEAVDANGRLAAPRWFANCDRATRGPQPQMCFVRGRKCWAQEAHFGGIVVVPYERRLSE